MSPAAAQQAHAHAARSCRSRVRALPPTRALVPPRLQGGNDVFDLGEALYAFLLRYGDDFDIRRVRRAD